MIIEGSGQKEDVDERVNNLRESIAKTTSDYDKEKLQERLGKLTGTK